MQRIKPSTVIFFIATVVSLALSMAGRISPAIGHAHPSQVTPIAQSPMPVTYITEVDADQIVMQITEGEFIFHGYLKRTTGNMFVGEDEQVRVMYDRDTGRVVVINVQTGDEYYNYFFSEVDEGSL